jgi:hypothetical protein
MGGIWVDIPAEAKRFEGNFEEWYTKRKSERNYAVGRPAGFGQLRNFQ